MHGLQVCQMKSEIRQSGSSYSARFLELVRKELRAPDGSAKALTKRHGVNRTTALGWEKKVRAKKPLLRKGSPRKLGAFEETEYLKTLFTQAGFQDPKIMTKPASGLIEKMSKSTAERNLRRWGIVADAGLRPLPRQRDRTLHLWRQSWEQPEETICGDNPPLRGTMWLMVTAKGLKGFMLTADESDDAVEQVATAALEIIRDRKRQLRTNHPGLTSVLQDKLPGWHVQLDRAHS